MTLATAIPIDKSTDTVTELREISPFQAEEWLRTVPDFQRKRDKRQVAKITLAIQRNEWRENGATIVFNQKGELIDGQHRLEAISLAGKTVKSLVVFNVSSEEETFHTIGDEKPRRLTDFLQCTSAITVASVIRIYWLLTVGVWPAGKGGGGGRWGSVPIPPIPDMLKLAKKWQKDIIPLVAPLSPVGRLTGQHSYCVFLMLYYTKLRPINNFERLAEFFARVGDGVGLTNTDPAYKLRQRFITTGSNEVIQRVTAQALILKSLHLYLDGLPCLSLKYHPATEEFPALRGYKK